MEVAGEPSRLAPLQQAPSGYSEPVCLPPLSQTQYVTSSSPQPHMPSSSYAPPPAPQAALAQTHQAHHSSQPQQQQQPTHSTHAHIAAASQPQTQSQDAQPPHQTTYAAPPPFGAPPNSGLPMLMQGPGTSSHPPPPTIDAYTAAYYNDYSNMTLNDGFDSNLQIMVDGGARWTAIDATTAIYSPYGPIGTGP